mgnify:CR=1 FL=1
MVPSIKSYLMSWYIFLVHLCNSLFSLHTFAYNTYTILVVNSKLSTILYHVWAPTAEVNTEKSHRGASHTIPLLTWVMFSTNYSLCTTVSMHPLINHYPCNMVLRTHWGVSLTSFGLVIWTFHQNPRCLSRKILDKLP